MRLADGLRDARVEQYERKKELQMVCRMLTKALSEMVVIRQRMDTPVAHILEMLVSQRTAMEMVE